MLRLYVLLCLLILTAPAAAEPLRIAVAANFVGPLETLRDGFEPPIEIISGASGKLYAQIRAGAPFHVFLSADAERPAALIAAGAAVPGSRLTYACGRLALFSRRHAPVTAALMTRDDVRRIAIANPALAPFGAAALEVLERADPHGSYADKLAYGQNIAQVYALTATGSADIGFVALAAVRDAPGLAWPVPESWHAPIQQDGVLTRYGAEHPDARAFLSYLAAPDTQARIAQMGYASACATARRQPAR